MYFFLFRNGLEITTCKFQSASIIMIINTRSEIILLGHNLCCLIVKIDCFRTNIVLKFASDCSLRLFNEIWNGKFENWDCANNWEFNFEFCQPIHYCNRHWIYWINARTYNWTTREHLAFWIQTHQDLTMDARIIHGSDRLAY